MPPEQSISIAIADDAEAFRNLICVYLARQGCTIFAQAANGKELLQQLAGAASLPEICILDTNMPEMNGYETASMLRLSYPGIKIIAYSFANETAKLKMMKSGADECIDKEAAPEKLLEAIVMLHHAQRS
jgi:CheY-like chemotaxis protein